MAGANPSFSQVHVIRAIFEIRDERVSRKTLVERLGVGEGSVRTILKRLHDEKQVSSTNAGHVLTEQGVEEVDEYLKAFTKPADFTSNDMIDGVKSIIIVHDAADKLSGSALIERDAALKAGATATVILAFTNGKMNFPSSGFDMQEYPETFAELGKKGLREGDVIVISSSDSSPKAQDAVLSVALKISNLG